MNRGAPRSGQHWAGSIVLGGRRPVHETPLSLVTEYRKGSQKTNLSRTLRNCEAATQNWPSPVALARDTKFGIDEFRLAPGYVPCRARNVITGRNLTQPSTN